MIEKHHNGAPMLNWLVFKHWCFGLPKFKILRVWVLDKAQFWTIAVVYSAPNENDACLYQNVWESSCTHRPRCVSSFPVSAAENSSLVPDFARTEALLILFANHQHCHMVSRRFKVMKGFIGPSHLASSLSEMRIVAHAVADTSSMFCS